MVMGTNARQGLIQDIVIGIVGGLIGGFLLQAVGVQSAVVSGLNLVSILVAFIGAVVLLGLIRVVRRA
jgi:uncharacterized membrane protein YeaQ/YmgE (transglycosylase-associated protein family)